MADSNAATVPGDIRATGKLVIGVSVPYPPNGFKNHIKAHSQRLELLDWYQETRNRGISANIRHDSLEARLEFCEHFFSVALDQFEARAEPVTASRSNTRPVTDRPWLDSPRRRHPGVSSSPSGPAPYNTASRRHVTG